jgi:hypothetical protein
MLNVIPLLRYTTIGPMYEGCKKKEAAIVSYLFGCYAGCVTLPDEG